MFLFVVAVFTGGSKIVLSTLAPADNRNDVIHSQLIRRTTATAIITCAAGQFLFPPARFTQIPGFFPFPLYLLFANAYYKGVGHISIPGIIILKTLKSLRSHRTKPKRRPNLGI
jgi:hypothetical protein